MNVFAQLDGLETLVTNVFHIGIVHTKAMIHALCQMNVFVQIT